jgi:vesicle coat complex subunit
MTLGKDVSALFPDVLKNIATQDLDQKKLVYLYLMYVGLLQHHGNAQMLITF